MADNNGKSTIRTAPKTDWKPDDPDYSMYEDPETGLFVFEKNPYAIERDKNKPKPKLELLDDFGDEPINDIPTNADGDPLFDEKGFLTFPDANKRMEEEKKNSDKPRPKLELLDEPLQFDENGNPMRDENGNYVYGENSKWKQNEAKQKELDDVKENPDFEKSKFKQNEAKPRELEEEEEDDDEDEKKEEEVEEDEDEEEEEDEEDDDEEEEDDEEDDEKEEEKEEESSSEKEWIGKFDEKGFLYFEKNPNAPKSNKPKDRPKLELL